MIPFLGINITEDKKNEALNGDKFIIARPSSTLSKALERSGEEIIEVLEESKLPLFVRIGHWLCGAFGAVAAVGILKALTGEDKVSLKQAYENAGWVFWLGAICLIVWFILKIVSSKKEEVILESDESKNTISNLEQIANNIYNELNVPIDAKEVDVLSFSYKIKNDKIIVRERGLETTAYYNYVFKIYRDSDNMYLVDRDAKYSFTLSSLKGITNIKKHISLPIWNKETEPNKGEYKQYKAFSDNFDNICFRHHYVLELEHNGEIWGIYFPCYELPIFEKITGLKAE